eukprot:TRINITY_DN2808_c0_g1_i1.p1 TRINITY_DN2808_c0_g1~~TRINITY_DN2808_c0_g1_i1.p1  ORF type:complete len:189 (-),score=22.97 TRINITY_DN2808_c0_g1_i1:30-596(-)
MVFMWDTRQKKSVHKIPHNFPVTAVQFVPDKNHVYTGGLDNEIKCWDIRNNETVLTLVGHTDTITGLKIGPKGSYILSNSIDNSLKVWDIRPYAPEARCFKVFLGATHDSEKNLLKCDWAPDGSMVTAGSSDRFVYIWDTTTRKIIYKLPGHKGSVNECVFHPKEPIIGSCSGDKTIFLGEISAYQGF